MRWCWIGERCVGVGVGVGLVWKIWGTALRKECSLFCKVQGGDSFHQPEGRRAWMVRMRVPVNRLTIDMRSPRTICLWTLMTSMGWVNRVATEHDVPAKATWSASLDPPEAAFDTRPLVDFGALGTSRSGRSDCCCIGCRRFPSPLPLRSRVRLLSDPVGKHGHVCAS